MKCFISSSFHFIHIFPQYYTAMRRILFLVVYSASHVSIYHQLLLLLPQLLFETGSGTLTEGKVAAGFGRAVLRPYAADCIVHKFSKRITVNIYVVHVCAFRYQFHGICHVLNLIKLLLLLKEKY